jgi:hypothetical protein
MRFTFRKSALHWKQKASFERLARKQVYIRLSGALKSWVAVVKYGVTAMEDMSCDSTRQRYIRLQWSNTV